uniref:DUF1223 domain-containing protein n=1 Tax=Phenylobacterium glaciei TaxID=2803784 RepID=A0A974P253_9CAUL|nr:DUF1223 domain-containing protein [Phenylobacterium glaciei]
MPRLLGLALSLILTLPAVAQAGPLTVVELFTSQGCSSCPPANANLAKLADRPDVLALSFGVTYWDQLGWKDTFASKAYTDRQWAMPGPAPQSGLDAPGGGQRPHRRGGNQARRDRRRGP